jgi:hypothetical protein
MSEANDGLVLVLVLLLMVKYYYHLGPSYLTRTSRCAIVLPISSMIGQYVAIFLNQKKNEYISKRRSIISINKNSYLPITSITSLMTSF